MCCYEAILDLEILDCGFPYYILACISTYLWYLCIISFGTKVCYAGTGPESTQQRGQGRGRMGDRKTEKEGMGEGERAPCPFSLSSSLSPSLPPTISRF